MVVLGVALSRFLCERNETKCNENAVVPKALAPEEETRMMTCAKALGRDPVNDVCKNIFEVSAGRGRAASDCCFCILTRFHIVICVGDFRGGLGPFWGLLVALLSQFIPEK